MAKYFVARVSSKEQNLARQLETAKKLGIPKENVFCDKISGRKKERPEYDRLKTILVAGDEVYFEELDRIGRDKCLIKEELEWFKDKKVILRVMDVPTTLMELPKGQEWIFEMVNNILIEVLGTIAEQEWKKIKKRREDGIAAMPTDEEGYKVSSKTGNRFGRSGLDVDLSLRDGESVAQACRRLGISRTTYYRKLGEVEV